jgi:uncharacterized membrane protein
MSFFLDFMRRKPLFLCLILLSLTGIAAAQQSYSHNQKLYFGESMDVNDYVIEYKNSNDDQQMLRVGRWTGTSFHIVKEIEGIEVYESEGDKIEVSKNMSLVIDQTGYDREGRFLDLSVSASKDVFSSGKLSSSVPDKIIISQGESADVPLTLSNTGYLNQTYALSSETNSSLTTSFSYQDFNVTNVYVGAGEDESVTAKIEVPDTTELGTYELRLVAENFTAFSESLQVEVRGAEVEREISLNLRKSYTQAESGEEIELPLRVRNSGGRVYRDRGGVSLENVEFDVNVPNGWDYTLRPETISTLRSHESQRVMLTVEVPEDAQPGDFFVEASASSEETSMEEPEKVRVNIREKSGMGVVGLILMIVSLGMLIFVYRKFGRR